MKKLCCALCTVLCLWIAACNKDDHADPVITFVAALNGANEENPTGSAATGTASGTYNMDTKVLEVTVNYTGITPTLGHIHKGAAGISGPVIFPFSNLASPINFTSPPLDATQEADLLSGLYYVNLHTTAFPAGEIRGQLLKSP